jgi:hypothetical protein
MAETTTRKAPASRSSTNTASGSVPALVVRYYKRMRLRRVYPVRIGWTWMERGVRIKDVTLRLDVSGAQVSPAELSLSPADPEAEATFYVTPLATGKLRRFVLEIEYQGIKIQEMSLPAKVTTQRWTKFFLLLALVLPLLILYVKYHPVERGSQDAVKKLILDNAPEAAGVTDIVPWIKDWVDLDDWIKRSADSIAEWYVNIYSYCLLNPAAFYACLVCLLLAMFSAWCHRAKRKKRKGESIPLMS